MQQFEICYEDIRQLLRLTGLTVSDEQLRARYRRRERSVSELLTGLVGPNLNALRENAPAPDGAQAGESGPEDILNKIREINSSLVSSASP